jgi:hypothetical protein
LRQGKSKKVKGKNEGKLFSYFCLLPFTFLLLPCFSFHFAKQKSHFAKKICENESETPQKASSNSVI